jgi:hypothetical protein
MKRAMILSITLCGAFGVSCASQDASTGGAATEAESQARPEAMRWDDSVMRAEGRAPIEFDVPVSVRTEPGQGGITVFGQTIDTNGDQWWISGRSGDGKTATPKEGVTLDPSPFWSEAPFDREAFVTLEREMASIRARGEEPDWDSLAASEPPEIFFAVNGYALSVKPYTAHEGILRRIHIDTPENGDPNEATVIGYYSRSGARSALELPKKKCIWCGDVQICVPGATCP